MGTSRTNRSQTSANAQTPITIPAMLTTTGHRLARNNVRNHAHDYTELILVTQGNCIVKTAEKTLSGKAGDLFIIPPRLSHFQPEEDWVGTSYIGFYCRKNCFDSSFRVISLKNEIYIPRWIEDLIDIHTLIMDSTLYEEVAVGILSSIIARIKQIELHLEETKATHPILRKAIETIQNSYTKVISVEQIAESADISASYLTKLFKRHLGCSPIQYQQKLRMRLARRYLLNPYMTVKQTAHKCGYESTNLFIRQFKKNHKISPGKWQQQFITEKI
jgi:AraC-like DNA-binding protein